MIADDKKLLMREIINCFEMGRKDVKYDVIYIYHDGPGQKRQITLSFGITEYGNLRKLIANYVVAKGKFADKFKNYLPIIGKEALVDNDDFKSLLIYCTRNDSSFNKCMDEIYYSIYFDPAYKWFDSHGFTTNLSMMVILDSFIHSGSILSLLLKRMDEELPVTKLSEEKAWIRDYVTARKSWLANHSNKILRGTVYRMDFMKTQIKNDNWNLDTPVTANDIKIA